MKRVYALAVVFLVILSATKLEAQMAGPVAFGLRASPDGGGFSAKFFLDKNIAIEAQLNGSGGNYYSDNDGPSMTLVGLAEYHIVLPDTSWRIFVGPGLHFGSWDRYNDNIYDNYRHAQGIFGIDGILGIEYVFKRVPLGISADVKPALNFAPDVAFFPNNFFGVGGRFYFGSNMHRRPMPQRPADR